MGALTCMSKLWAWLVSVGMALRGIVLWTLFKIFQASVAASFSFIIVAQASVAGFLRLFGEPVALVKVEAAREAQFQRGGAAAAAAADQGKSWSSKLNGSQNGPAIMVRAVAADPESIRPMHIFVEPEKGYDSDAWKQIGPYMRLYGHSAIANSQLFNPEFIHFLVPGVGSIPYVIADIYNRAVITAVGDPLAQENQWKYITQLFLEEFPDAYFYHASARYAKVLHDMGYYINDLGAETTLQVQSWTYSGKTRTVRSAARSARDAGVRVRELRPDELTPELRHRLKHEVSGDWLQQKAVADRELRVFVRNVGYEHIQLRDGVRIFVAEAYNPAAAPPAVVDPVLQGAALNAKPPKPPRSKSARGSLKSQTSAPLSRNDSALTGSSSTGSLSISLSTLTRPQSASVSCNTNTEPETATSASNRNTAEAGAAAGHLPQQAAAEVAASAGIAAAAPAADAMGAVPKGATPFATAAAAKAVEEQQGQSAAAAAAGAQNQPDLIGFILLDPLWEGGQEVGYVSSIVRMKRTAHQGTLKLLYEEIISKLRQEGKKELAFGFAPFFNVRDHVFKRMVHWMRWTVLYLYHCANNVYAFQNLAFSKIRYGAGLTEDGSAFRDSNVLMTHVYMAGKRYMPGWNIVDLYVLCMYIGFMDNVWDTWLKLTGIRKGGANLTSGATQLGGSELAHAPSVVPV